MSREVPVSMFHIGLATPCSTLLQVLLCLICFALANRRCGEASAPLHAAQPDA